MLKQKRSNDDATRGEMRSNKKFEPLSLEFDPHFLRLSLVSFFCVSRAHSDLNFVIVYLIFCKISFVFLLLLLLLFLCKYISIHPYVSLLICLSVRVPLDVPSFRSLSLSLLELSPASELRQRISFPSTVNSPRAPFCQAYHVLPSLFK